MRHAPNLYTFEGLQDATKGDMCVMKDGRMFPARPHGFYSLGNRFRLAWMVFTGKADALKWPGGQ